MAIKLKAAIFNPNSIQLPNQTLQKVEQHLIISSIPNLSNKMASYFTGIQKQAYLYLKFLEQGYNQLQEVFRQEQFLKQVYFDVLKAKHKSALQWAKLQEKYKNSLKLLQEYIRNVAIYTEIFSSLCQQALGLETEILYIPDSANPFIYQVKSLEDLLEKGHLTKAKIQKTDSELKHLILNLNKDIEKIDYTKTLGVEQATFLDNAYFEIIHRYNTYRYHSKTGKGVVSIILWEFPVAKHWLGMQLSQKGDLAETYANIVFQRQAIFSGQTYPQYDINIFMKKVTEVDSVSGFLEGDFIIGSKSYSVKSGQASPQGIVTAMENAKTILTLSTQGEILKYLQRKQHNLAYNKQGARKGLRNTIIDTTGKTVQQVFGVGSKI